MGQKNKYQSAARCGQKRTGKQQFGVLHWYDSNCAIWKTMEMVFLTRNSIREPSLDFVDDL